MKYKTIFVDAATVKNKSAWGISLEETNGDQLARDIQATVLENDLAGFELMQSMPVTSSKTISGAYAYTLTTGVILIFKQKNP
ncbi:MAG: hypothetical protein IPM82_05160 [Saprospiraceae bacterium]|nr:hypothetical protein [Saprospiraceae bacterium]